jgi:hypothetical protein
MLTSLGPLEADFVQQRILDGVFGRHQRPALSGGLAGAHHRLAHFGHDRADVGEVEVDEARQDHEVGDRSNAGVEHLVGHAEGLGEGRPLVGDPEEILVGNDDQGVDVALQFGDAGVGQAHAVTALEMERFGDHADGQYPALAGALGDDRAGAGPRASAHAGGDEDHVRAIQMLADLRRRFLGRRHAHLRMGSGSEPLGDADPELNAAIGLGEGELLGIGVGDDEFDALKARFDHVVDSVAARSADAEDHDPGLQFLGLGGENLERHG